MVATLIMTEQKEKNDSNSLNVSINEETEETQHNEAIDLKGIGGSMTQLDSLETTAIAPDLLQRLEEESQTVAKSIADLMAHLSVATTERAELGAQYVDAFALAGSSVEKGVLCSTAEANKLITRCEQLDSLLTKIEPTAKKM